MKLRKRIMVVMTETFLEILEIEIFGIKIKEIFVTLETQGIQEILERAIEKGKHVIEVIKEMLGMVETILEITKMVGM